MNPVITRARELFFYDRVTGHLIRKIARPNAPVGSVAGALSGSGAIYVRVIGRKLHAAHRIIWAMQTGAFPPKAVDHIDGDRANNAWANLRACTQAQNMQNRRRNSGKEEPLGAYRHGAGWQAAIRLNGRQIYIGYFHTPQEAHAAYCAAKRRLHTFNPEVRS